MKRKKVWRYYCEYCKKSGCSGGHMKKHETNCTLNPKRCCGMCKMLEQEPTGLQGAMQLLPDPKEHISKDTDKLGFTEYDKLSEAVEKIMPQLRDVVGNCPACIMAALRQKGIPVPVAKSFDYRMESKEVFGEVNAKGDFW